MLALMLSGAVALASLAFFFSAFFAPKLHRKDDFLWSGVGFFYGLVLWNCAQRFTGAILLGQAAVVVLVLAFAWQTLRLRAAIARNAIVEVPSFSLLDWFAGGLQRKPKVKTPVAVDDKKASTKDQDNTGVEPVTEAVKQDLPETGEQPKSVEDSAPAPVAEKVIDVVEQVSESAPTEAESVIETAQEVVEELNQAAETLAEEVVEKVEEAVEKVVEMVDQKEENSVGPTPEKGEEVLLKKPKSKLFQRLFGRKKQAVPPAQPKASQPEIVEQKVAVEPESSTAQTGDWDDEEDWGEDLPSTENSSPIGEISDEVTNDDQENDETKVIAAVETVQIEQQITLIEVPVSENTTAEEASADSLIEEEQIAQEEIVVDEVIAPISETTAAVIEVTVEELADPETNIEQDTDPSEVNEPEETGKITEAIASNLEEVPEPTTDFDETTVNTDSAEEEETQNEGEEKQNWADG
ncbi:Ycf66 family protein [Synechocystis sp. CACIAM 05]|uniref:Ycf66 family protein n=1 Tax=Synechocystis sp. CACIAM 05 TaxID=1933929 RepID=UPI00138E7A3C|nr:Ycf66 family protein [Synechocystis sp. CACIAM 05]QHU98936.1 hypothetical protein BWK47_01505 [Synechocystis sp. CACIAM 05]